jgi:hypothetical protein
MDESFFVGMEASVIFTYALVRADSSFTRVATIVGGGVIVSVRRAQPALGSCDDDCNGSAFEIGAQGRFVVATVFGDRPPCRT